MTVLSNLRKVKSKQDQSVLEPEGLCVQVQPRRQSGFAVIHQVGSLGELTKAGVVRGFVQ